MRASKYQKAIYSWVQEGRGNAIVQAVSGAGKTTVLVECSKFIQSDSFVFVAFNKHIAEELANRTGKLCKTIHSLGNSALYKNLGKLKIQNNKYEKLCNLVLDDLSYQYKDLDNVNWDNVSSTLENLVQLSQSSLVDVSNLESLENLINHHLLEFPNEIKLSDIQSSVERVNRLGIKQAEREKIISFNDMIWLPNVLDLDMSKFEWIFVDEVQDLSAAQLGIVLKSIAKGGRVLAVGDQKQAINGWSGSDCESFSNVKRALEAVELPLSICYRCPSSHLDLARKIVPSIEKAPKAIKGEVHVLKENDVLDKVQLNDFIICRTTAPLVRLCIKLIANKLPARVKGRDIGKQLYKIIKEVSKGKDFDYKYFVRFLREYEEDKEYKLSYRDNSESLIESLRDKVEAIRICYENFNVDSVEQLTREMEDLFSDDSVSILLSTVHKAKGLEGDRVFILNYSKLPMRWNRMNEWQLEQEMNLKYVALTRAKKELFLVD